MFFNTEQFHAGGEQPAHYRGRPRGCSEENPMGRKESWVGHSEWRPVSFNLSLVRGYVCPEMEKGWLLGKEPIISVALGGASVKGITLCQSSVSVAWLVMPIHWIRDEHTYMKDVMNNRHM